MIGSTQVVSAEKRTIKCKKNKQRYTRVTHARRRHTHTVPSVQKFHIDKKDANFFVF